MNSLPRRDGLPHVPFFGKAGEPIWEVRGEADPWQGRRATPSAFLHGELNGRSRTPQRGVPTKDAGWEELSPSSRRFIKPKHIPAGIAKSSRDFGRIRADRLNDLTSVSNHRING